MDEISLIKTFFESHNVLLSTAWLEGCVNWCKEENLPANYTLKDLQHKVFEQWLLLDLRDVEVPCLPPDLSQKVKYELNGNYSLQMMKVIDISRSKYSQLQKIRNISINTEPETESSKRVLQLTLTDGVQEVEAMEYKPISCINLNLSPGIKIRLMGPVMVRRGRIMLEDKNIKVLGGEVEDLIVPNAAENILAGALKLPLNPTPNVIQESLLTADKEIFNATGNNGIVIQNQNNIRSNTVNPRVNPSSSTIRESHNVPSAASSSIGQNKRQTLSRDEEEELRIATEIDTLMEIERDFEEQPAKRRKSRSKTPDMFDDVDDSVFVNIDIPPNIPDTTPKPVKNSFKNDEKMETDLNVHESLERENELFENFDIDAHLDQITKQSEWKPNTPQPLRVHTIEKLLKNMPNITNGKFRIRAKFDSVMEKLTVIDNEYHLVVKVQDETGDLTVKLHTDVVSDFSGYCPAALMSLKTGIVENNTEAQRKVVEALRHIKEKLIELDHVVEVHINMNERFPVILNILNNN